MPDSHAKLNELLDQAQDKLLSESSGGANPMQVLVAGALPMVRMVVGELAKQPGQLDAFLELMAAALSQLRSDEASAFIVLRGIDIPDGASPVRRIGPILDVPGNLERFCDPGASPGAFGVELGEPIGIPDLADWLL